MEPFGRPRDGARDIQMGDAGTAGVQEPSAARGELRVERHAGFEQLR